MIHLSQGAAKPATKRKAASKVPTFRFWAFRCQNIIISPPKKKTSEMADATEQVPGCDTTRRTIKAGTGDNIVEARDTVTGTEMSKPVTLFVHPEMHSVSGACMPPPFSPVHATGVVVQTSKKFWSTKDPGQGPFEYQVK